MTPRVSRTCRRACSIDRGPVRVQVWGRSSRADRMRTGLGWLVGVVMVQDPEAVSDAAPACPVSLIPSSTTIAAAGTAHRGQGRAARAAGPCPAEGYLDG